MNHPAGTEGVRLAIELGTVLLLDSPHAAGQFRSLLAGMIPGHYVIVTRPSAQYELGDSVLIRYLHQGSVYAFRSDVRGVVNNPVKLLLLGYPSSVQEQNLRSSRRLECTLPCRVSLGGAPVADQSIEGDAEIAADTEQEGNVVEHQGLLRDISREGCQVVLGIDEALTPETGTAIGVQIWVPPNETPFEVTGHAVRVGRDGRYLSIGIRFDAPAEEAYEQVRTFLEPQSD